MRLQVTARAQAVGGVSQADVSVDALVEIDPTFVNAGLYDINFSANIGVPEPDPSLLGVIAITTVALRRARRSGGRRARSGTG